MSGKVFPLAGNQRDAVNPADNVWLSASAGTGKTQVLSARVLRLLLRKDVDPSQILCLTFTKAGAAEMANRINAVLARWVRLDPVALAEELGFLGADIGPATQARARTLFASVLDCPGGGLRIDTIHAFSQWLIANFPGEADLVPGARPMEDRERELLAREVLAEMIDEGDAATTQAVEQFVTRKDPDALRGWLMQCASNSHLWQGRDAWQPPMRPRVLQLLGVPADADENWVAEAYDSDVFPDHQLRAMLPTLSGWNAKTGMASVEFIEHWLGLDANQRIGAQKGFYATLLKVDGDPRSMKKPSEVDPQFPLRQQEIADALALAKEREALLDLADILAPALELGRSFALRWDEAKTREGLLDFDDLIQRAAALLANSDAADWIRYKLDRRFDHILIDEAQDTNQSQWDIVFALIDDFFDGEGAAGDKLRTLFTVGDYKQAIFGFQGTSPENFARAKDKVRAQIQAARENALTLRERRNIPNWQELDLGQSFRSSKPVLEFVNRAIEAIGPEAFGLDHEPPPHVGDDRAGLVTLWNPVRGAEDDEGNEEQGWLARHDRQLADRIADQVHDWVTGDNPFILTKEKPPRPATPGDIMVLVRKRRELAALIVARLHAKGVPVAGVDRLRLGAPLVVKDLLAALKFASQPLDDLSLANLLASPLIGWSQDDLLDHVPREKGARLWDHLRKLDAPMVMETCERLRELLRLADYETPQALIAWLLIGPWQGRRKLIARLGREANDPIDELVNSAFGYEAAHTPSLTGFIQWFEASDEELKRDPDEAAGQVRVMTVHGSKGLQAPIVILADATGRPGQGGSLELEEEVLGDATGRVIPLPRLSKEEKVGPVRDAEEHASATEMQEHWRLLYVAMTRAEEGLFITGSLGPRDRNGPHEDSWYARLDPIFESDPLDDPLWGARREWGHRADPVSGEASSDQLEPVALPKWATTPIGPEPKPPRPLAPSAAGEEQGANPPLPPDALKAAARRGVLIHRLLERLPDTPLGERETAATDWVERHAHDLDPVDHAEIVASSLAVLENPEFAEIFSPDALAEVPVAATVGGIVIAGTVDRLLVKDDLITIVDFKTTRRPPQSAEQIPTSTLKQMAAYVAAIEVIYPGRDVRAAILYTHAPQLFALTDDQIGLHKNGLSGMQETFASTGIE
ncbi:MAG: double-strand break repair helicase AddA [Pseudomonadota bacterium]